MSGGRSSGGLREGVHSAPWLSSASPLHSVIPAALATRHCTAALGSSVQRRGSEMSDWPRLQLPGPRSAPVPGRHGDNTVRRLG